MAEGAELRPIPGTPPSLLNPPGGCRFNLRCSHVMDICRSQQPPLDPFEGNDEHRTACHLDETTKRRYADELNAEMMAQTS